MQPIAGQYPTRFEEIHFYIGLTISCQMNEKLHITYHMILVSHSQRAE